MSPNREIVPNLFLDALMCLWLTLCAVAFWGPYIGIVLSPNAANALYAAFLLSVIGVVLVQWLKSRTDAEKQAKASAPSLTPLPTTSESAGESGNGGN